VEEVPSCDTCVPGAQFLTARHARLPVAVAKLVFAVQPSHSVAPTWFWNSPAAQGAQLGWLVPDCDVPAGQGVHLRSMDEEPAKDAYAPAAHALCAVHWAAFSVALKKFAAQGEHARSDVAVGAIDT
jgi:hypothetical protein